MTVTALSPVSLATTMTTADATAPSTPSVVGTRRMHNPYLRAPVTAAPCAAASLPCTAAPSPLMGPQAAMMMVPSMPVATFAAAPYHHHTAAYQQQPQNVAASIMKAPIMPTTMLPPALIAKPQSASAAAALPHPMRPQPQLFQPHVHHQYSGAATPSAASSVMMMMSAAAAAVMPCSCSVATAAASDMGYPQYSAMSTMGSTMPSAVHLPPQQQQLQAYQPNASATGAAATGATVSVISHKDLSGSSLRFVRFTPLDTTSAAAPRRERPSGPFQAPAMPPVINEALMTSPDAASLVDVFVSQLPFDLPLQALRALADAVVPGAPIRIAHAAPHQRRNGAYDGCCFVKMPEADAHRFIGALHKRVLFDVFGLWVAEGPEALEDLTAYCGHMQAMRPEARRRVLCRPTPFSAVTAELAKRVYAF